MNKLACLALLSTLSFHSLANTKVVGKDLLPTEDLPAASCALSIDIDDLGKSTFCSGTLIEQNLILTANHCFNTNKENVYVTCQHPETGKQFSVKAESFYKGPKYSDAGILKLSKDMNLTIKPMKIASQDIHKEIKQINDNNEPHEPDCAGFGWGRSSERTKGVSLGAFADNIKHKQSGFSSNAKRQIRKDLRKANIEILQSHKLPMLAAKLRDKSIPDSAIPIWETQKYDEVKGMIEAQLSIEQVRLEDIHFTAVNKLIEKAENTYIVISSDDEEDTSVIYSGDSGGSIACINEKTDEWELMAVNSYITQHSKTKISIEGFGAAVSGNLLEWVNNKISEINNPLHYLQNRIRM